jgi:hypothetical protein
MLCINLIIGMQLSKSYSLFNESDKSDPDASPLEDNELFEVVRNL